MDLDQGINLAAADGQIIAKQDGSFDRNCSFNSDPLNGIAIQHSDGSKSYYYHFKNGGITSKDVGDTVVAGEYLGVIGSSGSSTLPHLHFEVYDSADNLIDPSVGPCNTLNTDTWWENPLPYFNPGVNAALTHSAPPQFNTCPETETTNESNQFNLGETVHYAIYLRDQRASTGVDLKITRPDGTVQFEWTYDLVDDFNISYWIWNFPNDMEGQWTWEATYNNETAVHSFNVGALNVNEQEIDRAILHPNPTTGNLSIVTPKVYESITVKVSNLLGQNILQESFSNSKKIDIDMDGNSGIYFVTVGTSDGTKETFRVIKN